MSRRRIGGMYAGMPNAPVGSLCEMVVSCARAHERLLCKMAKISQN